MSDFGEVDDEAIAWRVCKPLRERIAELEARMASHEAALKFIVQQEPMTFAECSVAEAIIERAKSALGQK